MLLWGGEAECHASDGYFSFVFFIRIAVMLSSVITLGYVHVWQASVVIGRETESFEAWFFCITFTFMCFGWWYGDTTGPSTHC